MPRDVQKPTSHRRLGFVLAVPPVTMALVLLTGELAFHLLPNSYRELVPWKQEGIWHTPGGTYVYHGAFLRPRQPPDVAPNVVRWNREGWHDRDHDLVRPRGVARVLVLGDSFVEGIQVQLDELYHRHLERALAARGPTGVEGIAMGASGWGQVQELEALTTKGLAYLPDLVIVELLPVNDVRNNHPELERLANEQIARSTWARVLFIDSLNRGLLLPAFLFDKLDLLIRRARGQQDPIDADVYRRVPKVQPDLWAEAWTRTASALGQMKEVTAHAGADLVVVIFSWPWEIEACEDPSWLAPRDIDVRLPALRVLEICAAQGIACLDLAPRLRRPLAGALPCPHLLYDGHWSRYGHRLAAEETTKFLVEETRIWQGVLSRVVGRSRNVSNPVGI